MDTPRTNTPKVEIEPGLTPPKLRLAGQRSGRDHSAEGEPSTEELLKEARAILVALKVDRSRVETRLAEQDRKDPIEVVKGCSALDKAITECQEAIERLDQLVHATKGG